MRHLVNKRSYRFRKFIDDFLVSIFPKKWIPLYNSVSFTNMPYKQCIQNRKWQDKVKIIILKFQFIYEWKYINKYKTNCIILDTQYNCYNGRKCNLNNYECYSLSISKLNSPTTETLKHIQIKSINSTLNKQKKNRKKKWQKTWRCYMTVFFHTAQI